MLKVVLSGAASRAGRLALAGLAVVLGVALVTAALTLADNARGSYAVLVRQLSAGTDVYVRGPETDLRQGIGDFAPVPAALVETVAKVPGVASAAGQVARLATLVDAGGRFLSPSTTTYLSSWPVPAFALTGGQAPNGPNQVVVDDATARADRLPVGATVRVGIGNASPLPARVVGTARPRLGGDLSGASNVFVATAWAQSVLGIPGRYDLIDVTAGPGVVADVLRARVAAVLPDDGSHAITSRQYADAQVANLAARAGSAAAILIALAALVLVVGGGVVLNAFSLLVHERTRELALLRAVGMSRRQVLVSVLGEAAVVGTAASAAGVALGVPAATALRRIAALSGRQVSSAPIHASVPVAVGTFVIGVAAAILAGAAPARRAMRVSPVEAFLPPQLDAVPPRRVVAAPVVLGVVGAATLIAGRWSPWMGPTLEIGGGVALAVAVIAAIPTSAPWALRAASRVLRRAGTPGDVARVNLSHTPGRYVAPAATLVLGVALVTSVAVVAGSARASVDHLVLRADRADLVVVSDAAPGVDLETVEKIREAPAVSVVSELGTDRFTVDGRAAQFTAIDSDSAPKVLDLPVLSGNMTGFADGQIVLTRREARAHRYRVGGYVAVRLGSPQVRYLTITAIIGDNGITQGYVLPFETYRRGYTASTVRAVFVKATPGAPPDELRHDVDFAVSGFPGVSVLDAPTYAAVQARKAEGPVDLVQAMVALAIVVALLGVADSLGLAVVERTSELSLLRVLGMTRGQLMVTVGWEAVAVGLLGAAFGVLAGLGLGLGLVGAATLRGLGELVIPIGRIAVVTLAVVAGALIAAILPARRAARLTGLEVLGSSVLH